MIHFRSVCISGHLDPLCRALDGLSKGSFLFVFQTQDQGAMRRKIGWDDKTVYKAAADSPELQEVANAVDLLVTGLKETTLFESRVCNGRVTVYSSERWFKPRKILGVWVPGILKLLSPAYRHEAMRIARLLDTPYFYAMPIGVHAVRDMARLSGILHGVWPCFFAAPKLVFEACAGGRVLTDKEARELGLLQENEEQYLRDNGYVVVSCDRWPRQVRSCCRKLGLANMRLGGYYVAAHDSCGTESKRTTKEFKLLWVGRYLKCKCVPTIVQSFKKVLASCPSASLLLVGEGSERARCLRVAGGLGVNSEEPKWVPGKIVFSPFVRNDTVRRLMRETTLYIMASNAIEGWGAVVSEAIAEGCPVISSIEVGSAATMLSPDRLFHSGNVDELVRLMLTANGVNNNVRINDWSGEVAAEKIMFLVNERRANEGY